MFGLSLGSVCECVCVHACVCTSVCVGFAHAVSLLCQGVQNWGFFSSLQLHPSLSMVSAFAGLQVSAYDCQLRFIKGSRADSRRMLVFLAQTCRTLAFLVLKKNHDAYNPQQH